jgi:bacterioferritin
MIRGERATPMDVLHMLGEALNMEFACVLRYKRQYIRAAQISSKDVQAKFLQYAHEQQTHARHIGQRIVELGDPNLDHVEDLSPCLKISVEIQSLMDMLLDDVIAARIAIHAYQQLLVWVDINDSMTRQLVDGILADRQKHAEELLGWLRQVAERAASEVDPHTYLPWPVRYVSLGTSAPTE